MSPSSSLNPNYRDAGKTRLRPGDVKGGGDAMAAARAVLESAEYDFAWNLQLPPKPSRRWRPTARAGVVASFGAMVERIDLNQSDASPSLPEGLRSTLGQSASVPDRSGGAARRCPWPSTARSSPNWPMAPPGKATCTILPVPEAYRPRSPGLPDTGSGGRARPSGSGRMAAGAGWHPRKGRCPAWRCCFRPR